MTMTDLTLRYGSIIGSCTIILAFTAYFWFILVKDVFLAVHEHRRLLRLEKEELLRELARDVMES